MYENQATLCAWCCWMIMRKDWMRGDDCLGWLLDEGSIKDYCPFQSVREIVIKMSFYISIYEIYIFWGKKIFSFYYYRPLPWCLPQNVIWFCIILSSRSWVVAQGRYYKSWSFVRFSFCNCQIEYSFISCIGFMSEYISFKRMKRKIEVISKSSHIFFWQNNKKIIVNNAKSLNQV